MSHKEKLFTLSQTKQLNIHFRINANICIIQRGVYIHKGKRQNVGNIYECRWAEGEFSL